MNEAHNWHRPRTEGGRFSKTESLRRYSQNSGDAISTGMEITLHFKPAYADVITLQEVSDCLPARECIASYDEHQASQEYWSTVGVCW